MQEVTNTIEIQQNQEPNLQDNDKESTQKQWSC